MPGRRPDRPYGSVARVAGCPTLDSEPRKPPQTQPQTGALKFPTHTLTHTRLRNTAQQWWLSVNPRQLESNKRHVLRQQAPF